MLSKADYKKLLRITKEWVKLNYFIKDHNLSQSAISRFINYTDYDMISSKTLSTLCDEVYNHCSAFVEIYENMNKNA